MELNRQGTYETYFKCASKTNQAVFATQAHRDGALEDQLKSMKSLVSNKKKANLSFNVCILQTKTPIAGLFAGFLVHLLE